MVSLQLLHFCQSVIKTSRAGLCLRNRYGGISVKAPFSSTVTPTASVLSAAGDQEREVDELIASMQVLLKGHDTAVMDSYEKFVTMVCRELQLPMRVEDRNRPHFVRLTLNRSPFVHKKHMRQYEFRTYCKTLHLSHLTGSTASVFLEYIQRNLPEGMAMHVRKERLEPLTEFLHKLNGDVKQTQ